MKKIMFLTFVAAFALALAGCETTKETNTNKAVVVNNNANMMNANMMNANMMNANTTSRVNYDKEITREEYDKDKDLYLDDAKSAGRTIGSGVEDGWLWTKTTSALATTNDLRDSTIDVDVENAVVTLSGTVASKTEMEKAVKVAQEIKDVKSVKNNLKVAPGDSMTNQMMTDDPNTKSNANTKN